MLGNDGGLPVARLDRHGVRGLDAGRVILDSLPDTPNGRLAYCAGDLFADLAARVCVAGGGTATPYVRPDRHW